MTSCLFRGERVRAVAELQIAKELIDCPDDLAADETLLEGRDHLSWYECILGHDLQQLLLDAVMQTRLIVAVRPGASRSAYYRPPTRPDIDGAACPSVSSS